MKTKLAIFFSSMVAVVFSGIPGAIAQAPDDAANAAGSGIPEIFFQPVNYLIAFIILILIVVIYAMHRAIIALTKTITGEGESVEKTVVMEEAGEIKKASAWNELMDRLTRAVPVEKEKDILLNHNYDGIRELDNQLPPWWKWGFYVTIVFAFIYLAHYHLGSGKLMAAEYDEELKVAAMEKAERLKEAKNNVTEENVTLLAEANDIEEGKNIFQTNCVTCHGNNAQGTETAPNLTDPYWLHGGGIKNVFRTITNGVPGKAMISWQSKLSPRQINQVASFVLSLEGSDPAGAKQPEGELYIPDATQPNTPATDSSIAKTK